MFGRRRAHDVCGRCTDGGLAPPLCSYFLPSPNSQLMTPNDQWIFFLSREWISGTIIRLRGRQLEGLSALEREDARPKCRSVGRLAEQGGDNSVEWNFCTHMFASLAYSTRWPTSRTLDKAELGWGSCCACSRMSNIIALHLKTPSNSRHDHLAPWIRIFAHPGQKKARRAPLTGSLPLSSRARGRTPLFLSSNAVRLLINVPPLCCSINRPGTVGAPPHPRGDARTEP